MICSLIPLYSLKFLLLDEVLPVLYICLCTAAILTEPLKNYETMACLVSSPHVPVHMWLHSHSPGYSENGKLHTHTHTIYLNIYKYYLFKWLNQPISIKHLLCFASWINSNIINSNNIIKNCSQGSSLPVKGVVHLSIWNHLIREAYFKLLPVV